MMTKEEFLNELGRRLEGIPKEDMDRSLDFYGEMIADLTEEGKSEEEAVASLGTIDKIVSDILADIPLQRLAKEKIKPNRALRAWEIILLIIGAPLWIPLLIAAFAILLSIYVVIWSLIVSLYAVSASVAAIALGSAVLFVLKTVFGTPTEAIFYAGGALFAAGLAILLFICTNLTTKAFVKLSIMIPKGIKRMLIGKGKRK